MDALCINAQGRLVWIHTSTILGVASAVCFFVKTKKAIPRGKGPKEFPVERIRDVYLNSTEVGGEGEDHPIRISDLTVVGKVGAVLNHVSLGTHHVHRAKQFPAADDGFHLGLGHASAEAVPVGAVEGGARSLSSSAHRSRSDLCWASRG